MPAAFSAIQIPTPATRRTGWSGYRLFRLLAVIAPACVATAVSALLTTAAWAASDDGFPGQEPARISVLLATGMPGGTSYQAGLEMASLWTTKLRKMGVRVSAALSEGSRENIEAIRIADADLILVEQLFCSMAYHGTGLFRGRPVPELRSMVALWPETVQILIGADRRKSGTLSDLEGLTLAVGLPDSGNRFTTELLVSTTVAAGRKVSLRSMSTLAAAEALRNGYVQAMDAGGGFPVPVVTALFEEPSLKLGFLDVTDAQMEAAREQGWKGVFRSIIPPGTYPGQTQAVNSVGQMNLLGVTASLDAQVVYALTRSLFENLDDLRKVHPACRSIDLEKALAGLDVPLHRGAVRYYKEKKIKIPEHLVQ